MSWIAYRKISTTIHLDKNFWYEYVMYQKRVSSGMDK